MRELGPCSNAENPSLDYGHLPIQNRASQADNQFRDFSFNVGRAV